MRSQPTSSSSRSPFSCLLSLSTLSTLLLLLPAPSAGFSCEEILAQGVPFNFKALGGPKVVHWEEAPKGISRQFNYNFTIDICNVLKRHKGVPKETQCRPGTRICGVEEEVYLDGQHNSTITPIEIAGTYATGNINRKIDAQFELLRNSKSHSDSGREGVRIELHGGRKPFEGKDGIDQRAIIEFVCDKDRTGLEGDEVDDGETEDGDGDDAGDDKGDRLWKRDDNCEDSDASLRFCGYELEDLPKDKKVQTLRLEWRTKDACEDAEHDEGSHWGFFTWFIIILFLATATYLIFGSWLNYNRYGARGWDLLPHGDTIRDVPYILKDLGRRVKDTIQGPGTRGGYSAV